MSYWSKLSMKDRANVMRLFLDKGISDLDTIRREYNTFAEGGSIHNDEGGNTNYSYTRPLDNVYVDSEGNVLDPSVPSAKGTIRTPDVVIAARDPRKPVPTANSLSSIESPITQIRNTLYRRILPISDYNIKETLSGMLDGEFDYSIRNDHKFDYEERYPEKTDYTTIGGTKAPLSVIDGIWAEYLQIPQKDRKKFVGPTIQQSKYRPSSGGKSGTNYYALPLTDGAKTLLVNEGMELPIGKNKVTETLEKEGRTVFNLGDHTIGRGMDAKGDYISYYDVFDLNPFSDKYNGTNIPLLNKLDDASFGIGKPVHIYDRIYLDDFYEMPQEYRGSAYLPEVEVRKSEPFNIEKTYRNLKHAHGGKIHIDPSKKGTFTAAASRHGMGVQEFASRVLANKENYSPAMVKKANFARNFGSKKKSYGGYIE